MIARKYTIENVIVLILGSSEGSKELMAIN